MYNILISVSSALAVMLILLFGFDMAWWGALMIALTVLMGVYYLFMRIILKKVMAAIEIAGKDIQAKRIEKGIRELKDALKYSKWQIYVEGQLNAQIGSIYYLKRDFNDAFPYLEKSFFKNWSSMTMLAICYMKRQKKDMMIKTFEKTIQWCPKEPMLWNIYAYCLNECGDANKAKEVMANGLKKNPENTILRENLECLEKGKKMKMRSYGEAWFQFHLESLAAIQKHQMATMGGNMHRRMHVRR